MSKIKEEIYDEKINHLMAEVIEVCEKNDIAMLCSFELDYSEVENSYVRCTSYIESEVDNENTLKNAKNIILGTITL